MRKVLLVLLYTSRFLAICAVLAGLGAGLLTGAFGAFVCVDSCPTPVDYFPSQGPTAVWVMIPCVALAVLALLTFTGYCIATRQARRAIVQTLVLVVGGVVGSFALNAFMLHGQASVPLTFDDYFADSGSLEAWVKEWGLALTVVAGVWSGSLAYLQWAA